MYKAFFHLENEPFDLAPNPAYFVSTTGHNEALASLYYGVREHKGFVVVTGEVGTGKTLMLRCLLKLLGESKNIAYAYVYNSKLSPTEFLQYIASDFGLCATGKNRGELLFILGQFLAEQNSKRMTTVLIVDEAHLLSEETIEEVRLLSNLETTEQKLLQIVLAGQPELDEKLDSFGLRQFKQRIALRTRLSSLSLDETKKYIERRLEIAGAESTSTTLFPTETIAAVFRFSRGFPRLINTICGNALIAAYAKQSSSVTPAMIENVAKDFRLNAASFGQNEKDRGHVYEHVPEDSEIVVDRLPAL